jgi:hypothetical protein
MEEVAEWLGDDNSFVEVIVEFILRHTDCVIDILGKHEEEDNLWVYHVSDVEHGHFGCITTDVHIWGDKRVKNPIKKYKNSTIFYITNTETAKFDQVDQELFQLHFSFDKKACNIDNPVVESPK